MALAFFATRGSANEKVSDTSLGVVLTGTIAVGALAIAACVTDNISTVDGETNDHSTVTDTQGNTWTKIKEYTNTVGGVAADGVCVSIWYCVVTVQLTTADTVTLTTVSATTAKAIGITQFSAGAGNSFAVEASATPVGQDNNTTGPTTSLASLVNREHLFLALDALEGPAGDTYTQDAAFTTRQSPGSTGGTANQNVTGRLGTRVATETARSHAGSNSVARDWAGLLAAIEEVFVTSFGHGTNGILRATRDKSFATSGTLLATRTLGHATTGVLRATSSLGHGTAGLLRGAVQVGHATTGILRTSPILGHVTAGGLKLLAATKGHATTGILSHGVLKGHATTGILRSGFVLGHATAGVIDPARGVQHFTSGYLHQRNLEMARFLTRAWRMLGIGHRDEPDEILPGAPATITDEVVTLPPVQYGPDPAQVLDVTVPPPSAGLGPFAVVLTGHGGGYFGGKRIQVRQAPYSGDIVGRLAREGPYVVVNYDYRLSKYSQNPNLPSVNLYPAAEQDVVAVFNWVRNNIADYGGDPDNIVVAGGSAGASLALMAGTGGNAPALKGSMAWSPGTDYRLHVHLAGPPYDFSGLSIHQKEVLNHLGCNCDGCLDYDEADCKPFMDGASPIVQLAADHVPIALYGSTAENPGIPVFQFTDYYDEAVALGVPIRMRLNTGNQHADYPNAFAGGSDQAGDACPYEESYLGRLEQMFGGGFP